MIGLIFNTLESVVVEEFGEDTWDDILEQANSDGVYHGLGSYQDEEITRLVVASAKLLNKEPSEILRWFGQQAAHKFHQKMPDMFTQFDSFFSYILSLNDIIHPHVKELYPNSQVPYFKTISHSDDELIVEYVSARQMCHLAEGLIVGSAEIFQTKVIVEQPKCVHHGAVHCHLRITINRE